MEVLGILLLQDLYFYFLFFRKFTENKKKPKTGVARVFLIISISMGVIEYYPRVISFTPQTLATGETWPLWSEEVIKWEVENKYNPVIWPYLSNNNGLWPDRDTIYRVNLNEPESWQNQGKLRFSSEIKHFFKESEE